MVSTYTLTASQKVLPRRTIVTINLVTSNSTMVGTMIAGKIITVVILGTMINVAVAVAITIMDMNLHDIQGIVIVVAIVIVTAVGAEVVVAVLLREIVEGKLAIETWIKHVGTK